MGSTFAEARQTRIVKPARLQGSFFHTRLWMAAVLVLADSISLLVTFSLSIGLWTLLGRLPTPGIYLHQAYIGVFFILVYLLRGLYTTVGISPVDEIRRLTGSTIFIYLAMIAVIFWAQESLKYSRGVFGLSLIFSLVLVPSGRFGIRAVLSSLGLWGESVAIIGYGPQAEEIEEFLRHNPQLGLNPGIIVDGDGASGGKTLPIPVFHSNGHVCASMVAALQGIQTAIIVTPEVPSDLMNDIVELRKVEFLHIVLISKLNQMGTIGISPYDIGGLLGLHIGQNLLDPWQKVLKRLLDIVLVLLIGFVSLPLLLAIAVLVKLTSKGKVFYGHTRIGEGGRPINIWKFRTMVKDADRTLQNYLDLNPNLRAEWERNFKLKDDPRITPIGEFLRKFSLDELPQLLNVLSGEMSLVGPRPIVDAEIERYDGHFHLYTRVKPGITGMWQVSGRSEIRYGDRVKLDEYYVRNWSIWMDIYILARTIPTVLTRKGAC